MAQRKVTRKAELDRRISADTGYPLWVVTAVTEALVRHLRVAIAENAGAYLEGLGRFSLRVSTGGKRVVLVRGNFKRGVRLGKLVLDVPFKVHVNFSKSPTFKAYLAEKIKLERNMTDPKEVEEEMCKYGVDEAVDQEDLEKQAARGCPRCGAAPTRQGKVLLCPVHGSEPFEATR